MLASCRNGEVAQSNLRGESQSPDSPQVDGPTDHDSGVVSGGLSVVKTFSVGKDAYWQVTGGELAGLSLSIPKETIGSKPLTVECSLGLLADAAPSLTIAGDRVLAGAVNVTLPDVLTKSLGAVSASDVLVRLSPVTASAKLSGDSDLLEPEDFSILGGAVVVRIHSWGKISIEKAPSIELKDLHLTPSSLSLPVGSDATLTATGILLDQTHSNLSARVTWSSSNKKVADFLTEGVAGVIHGKSAGTTTAKASYNGKSATVLVTVTSTDLVRLEVTPVNPTAAVGTVASFIATGVYADLTTQDLTSKVTWASTVPSVATMSGHLATALAPGQATVSASLGSMQGMSDLTVSAAILTAITIVPNPVALSTGGQSQLLATGHFDDSSTQDITASVNWSSVDSSVVTMSATTRGLAVAAGIGSTSVHASFGSIVATAPASVSPATLTAIAISPSAPSVAKGTTRQMTATGTYSDGSTQNLTSQVTWTSSNAAKATVSNASGSAGLLAAAAVGSSTITATFGSVSGNTVATISPATLVSIQVTPTDPTFSKGLTQQFTATGTFTDSSTQDLTTQVTWSSSNTVVVGIGNANGSRGLATGIDANTATVTAALGSVSGNTNLTIGPPVLQSIALTVSSLFVEVSQTRQFTATGTYSDASIADITGSVTWASDASSKATVTSGGLATGVAVGSSHISATSSGVSASATLSITTALISIDVTPATPTVAKGLTQQFTATGTFSDSSTADMTSSVTWASSDPGKATINAGSGLAATVATGTTTISATSGSVSGNTLLTVTSPALVSIAVTPATPSFAKGLTQQFTATGTYTDNSTQDLTATVTWASAAAGTATISNTGGSRGLCTSVATGSSVISATSGSVSGSTTATVTAATLVSLQVTPANPSIAKGLTQQFTATGTYTDSSTQNLTSSVTWTSATTSRATVSNAGGSQGLVTTIATGSSVITATSGSITANTTATVAAPALVSIQVTPATPSFAKGLTQQFTATGTYTDSSTQNITTSVTWASASTGSATISNSGGSQGLAAAVATGSSVISAASGSVSGNTTATVTAPTLLSLQVTPATPSIATGLTQQFTATGTYTDSSTQDLTASVTWSSATTSRMTISTSGGSEGLATAVATGTSVITATSGSVSASTTATVTAPTLQSIAVTASSLSLPVGQTRQFTATGTYSDATTADISSTATWASDDTSKATVNSAGLASGLVAGTVNISASLSGKSGSAALTVTGGGEISSLDAAGASLTIDATTVTVGSGVASLYSTTTTTTLANTSGALTINGAASADTITLTATTAGHLTIKLNSGQTLDADSIPSSITVAGAGGDDQVFLNLNGTTNLIPAGGVSVQATAGTASRLRLTGSGSETLTYTPHASTAGTGTLAIGARSISVSGLSAAGAGIDLTGHATVTVAGPNANNTIDLTSATSFTTLESPAAAGVLVTGTTGGVAFAPVTIWNVTSFSLTTPTGSTVSNDAITATAVNFGAASIAAATVNTGNSGSDSITIAAGTTTVAALSVVSHGSFTLTGDIAATGTVSLSASSASTLTGTIAGATTLLLSGNATFAMASAGRLIGTPNVQLDAGTQWDFANFSQTIGSLSTSNTDLANSIYPTIALGTGTLTVGAAGDSTFDGVISGAGGKLVKEGAGNLTLGKVNIYSGATTINAGALTLGVNNAVSTSTTLTINNGAVFATGTYNNILTALILVQGSVTGSGTLTIGSTLSLQSGSISANLAGTAAATKTTSGTVTIAGILTRAGNVTISAGTLTIASTGQITGTSGTIILSAASTVINGTGQISIPGGIVVNAAGVTIGASGAGNGLTVNKATAAGITVNSTGTAKILGNIIYTGLDGSGNAGSYTAVAIDVVGGKALIQDNDLSAQNLPTPVAGTSYAYYGIRIRNGGVVDAGQLDPIDFTGLASGTLNTVGSGSSGYNKLSGYQDYTGATSPASTTDKISQAIINLNTNNPNNVAGARLSTYDARAQKNDFGYGYSDSTHYAQTETKIYHDYDFSGVGFVNYTNPTGSGIQYVASSLAFYSVAATELTSYPSQKSMIRRFRLAFDRPVTIASGAMSFTYEGTQGSATGAGTAVGLTQTTITYDPSSGEFRYEYGFNSGTYVESSSSLVDGMFKIVFDASKVTDSAGTAMAATPADVKIYRIFGDINGDGYISSTNQTLFNSALGKLSNQAGFIRSADYNNDGSIDSVTDLVRFNTRKTNFTDNTWLVGWAF